MGTFGQAAVFCIPDEHSIRRPNGRVLVGRLSVERRETGGPGLRPVGEVLHHPPHKRLEGYRKLSCSAKEAETETRNTETFSRCDTAQPEAAVHLPAPFAQ